MARNCIVVNLDRCTGCFGCEVACKMENGVALGERWSKVFTVGPVGEYPDMTRYALPTMCQQCENAPCVSVCPTGASYRDPETNIVLVDKEKCIGCKYCMAACPYQARWVDDDTGEVGKCTFCHHRTAHGLLPACVSTCVTRARYFGDLDDPSSDIAKKVADVGGEALFADLGLNPSVLYVGLSQVEGLPATSAIHRGGNVVKPYEG